MIGSWLEKRTAVVVVDGANSTPFDLSNSVYQGTTWGPPLWNIYFADARFSIEDAGFQASLFADDLNAFRNFSGGTDHEVIFDALGDCQEKLHTWGAANQVLFDTSKERFVVIHPVKNSGDNFKILGVLFDTQLKMEKMACEMVVQGHGRISMSLRSRRFYASSTLLRFYKSFVLSFFGISDSCNLPCH